MLAGLMLAACGGAPAEPTRAPTPTPTTEFKLAALHGDLGAEREFARILDQMQAGAGCNAEPNRERAGDILYASWTESAQTESLLDWARALIAICGG